jgi:hypothetical protein
LRREASDVDLEADFSGGFWSLGMNPGLFEKKLRSAVSGCSPSNGLVNLDEQISIRPPAGQVEPDFSDRGLNPSTDLEQLQSNRGGFRFLQGGSRQPLAKEMHQVVGQGMQLKPEGVRTIPMATESVSLEIGFPFIDAVLGFSTTVVDVEQIFGSSCSIGHHASDVDALAADFYFDQDPTLAGPSPTSIPKAGEDPYGFARAFEPSLSSSNHGIGMTPKHLVVGDSDEILDVLLFQEVQQLGRSKAGIGSKADRSPGKGTPKTRKDSLQFGEKTFEIGSRSGT